MSTCNEASPGVHAVVKRARYQAGGHITTSPCVLRRGRTSHVFGGDFLPCFTADTFIPHATSSLQTGSDACRHPNSSVREARFPCKRNVPRGEPGPTDGKERTRTGTGSGTGARMGTVTGAGTVTVRERGRKREQEREPERERGRG